MTYNVLMGTLNPTHSFIHATEILIAVPLMVRPYGAIEITLLLLLLHSVIHTDLR